VALIAERWIFVLNLLDIQTVSSNTASLAGLPDICSKLLEAKARKGVNKTLKSSRHDWGSLRYLPGLTFDQIAKAIGKDEIWVASGFYGQVGSV
jgi:cyanate lyase